VHFKNKAPLNYLKETAEKCQAWRKEHKSCNIEITSHAEENKLKVK